MGLPVMAGHVGVLRQARELGLRAIADFTCNTYSSVTMGVLVGLGAEATVLSLECSSREIARLVARLPGYDLPQIAVVVQVGYRPCSPARITASILAASRRIQAVEREGGLPYQIVRHAGGWTGGSYEARHLADPEHAKLCGMHRAWWMPGCWSWRISRWSQMRFPSFQRALRWLAGVRVMVAASRMAGRRSRWWFRKRHAALTVCFSFPADLATGSRALALMQPEAEIDESVRYCSAIISCTRVPMRSSL